jgi:hypothetical protein
MMSSRKKCGLGQMRATRLWVTLTKFEFRVLVTRRLMHLYTIDSDDRIAKENRVVGKPTVPLCMCWGVKEIPAYSISHHS